MRHGEKSHTRLPAGKGAKAQGRYGMRDICAFCGITTGAIVKDQRIQREIQRTLPSWLLYPGS